MILLQKQFNVADFIYSKTAKANNIDNSPTIEHLTNLAFLHKELIHLQEEVSKVYGRLIEFQLNSVYRSLALNNFLIKKSGRASKTSQHMLGLAADVVALTLGHDEFYQCVRQLARDKKIVFDQLIKEFGTNPETSEDDWIHHGKKQTGNRLMCLISHPGQPYEADPLG